MSFAEIIGIGHHVPETVVSNDELVEIINNSLPKDSKPACSRWVQENIGVTQRHFFSASWKDNLPRSRYGPMDNEPFAVMGAKAAKAAIESAGISKDNIAGIVCACMGSDRILPSVSGSIGRILGLDVFNFDIKSACSGFTYGLALVDSLLSNPGFAVSDVAHGAENNVYLFVCTEANSSLIDFSDRDTSLIFGDAAAALLLRLSSDERAIYSHIGGITHDSTNPKTKEKTRGLWTEYNAALNHEVIGMNGQSTFKEAIKSMVNAVRSLIETYRIDETPSDILVPHQANIRIMEPVAEKLGFDPEKVLVNIDRYGNTISASIPLALSEAYHQGMIMPGDRIFTVSYGGGRTYGSNAIMWNMQPPKK